MREIEIARVREWVKKEEENREREARTNERNPFKGHKNRMARSFCDEIAILQ